MHEDSKLSKTYLVLDTIDLENGIFKIYGYVTLAMKPLDVPEGTSKSQIKRKNFSVPQEDMDLYISCFLIGQFAKNDLYKNNISGKEIMELAYLKIEEAQDIIGGRVILLDVKSEATPVINFYETEGFKKVLMEPEDQKYLQMVKYIY